MIVSFECRETKKIWDGVVSLKLPREIQQTARRKLVHINSAVELMIYGSSGKQAGKAKRRIRRAP